MYHVRYLAKVNVDHKIICYFHHSVISSVLCYAISCWFNACSVKDKLSIEMFRKRVLKLTNPNCENIILNVHDVHNNQCLSLLRRILSDNVHPLYNCFKMLRNTGRMNVIYCRTNRAKTTFVHTAISIFNKTK